MFRPVKMAKVNILLMSKHVTEITRVLGQRGLIHLVDAVNQSGGRLLSEVDQEQDEKTMASIPASSNGRPIRPRRRSPNDSA